MHILLTGPNGEPKITHGNTLVSDLSLEKVAETINVRLLYNHDIIQEIFILLAGYYFDGFVPRNMHFVCQITQLFYHWKITAMKHNR